MAYSPTGSSDLFLILGCTTSNFLYLSFSTLNSSSLWRTDTIVFAKLVKPPVSIKPPLKFIYQGFADISSSREWFEVTAAVHKPNWTQIKDLQHWEQANLLSSS